MQKDRIEDIPVDEIRIINPRDRNQLIAEGIHQNIQNIGLKRPITVTISEDISDGKKYDLVCGQGRLEAFIKAGEKMIPASVLNVSREVALLMSLAENFARRKSNGLELLQSIKYLRAQGYDEKAIASKTDLSPNYIASILRLIDKGEEYLVNAVENGKIPVYLATSIANETDTEVQRSLTEAYESQKINGNELVRMQKIVSRRNRYGKKLKIIKEQKTKLTAEKLIEQYENTVKEKKSLLRQSMYIKQCITYVSSALQHLLCDRNFTNRLRAVGLNDIPERMVTILGGQTHGN